MRGLAHAFRAVLGAPRAATTYNHHATGRAGMSQCRLSGRDEGRGSERGREPGPRVLAPPRCAAPKSLF